MVVVVLVAAGLWLASSPAPKSPFVTTFQKGEFQVVPNACKVLGATELSALLKGTAKAVQPQASTAQSQCTYTVDAKPVFRVLSILVTAYPASLTAPGTGSATANATYTFTLLRDGLAKPPKHSAEPPATITTVPGLGSQAIKAVQIFRTGLLTDKVIMLIRYRNVLITASLMGGASGGFGPVTVGELATGAMSAASSVFAAVKAEPTVG